RRDQRRLLDPDRADRDRHFSVPHPRALRDGRHPPAARASRGAAVSAPGELILAAILAVPVLGAALLAFMSDDRKSAWLNAFVSFLTFLCALALLIERPAQGPFLIVDDLNVVFILISTLVAFTTSVFSATYIAHELE